MLISIASQLCAQVRKAGSVFRIEDEILSCMAPSIGLADGRKVGLSGNADLTRDTQIPSGIGTYFPNLVRLIRTVSNRHALIPIDGRLDPLSPINVGARSDEHAMESRAYT
ncbi:hypothetical protein [Burkholderia contaminans]|uniref:hypothetical protein n=1 Tax=Burkholderia contaminans TaxID=488447 RepID=UPI001588EDCE|nr:hypothetical protein [Burkholderia contaminans]